MVKRLSSHRFLFIAKDGIPIILGLFFLGVLFSLFHVFFISVPILTFALFSIWFFRDPQRKSAPDERTIVSPADGRVVEAVDSDKVRDVDLGEFVGEYKRLSIFMSVISVHVNRAPCFARVRQVIHRLGKFLPADKSEASFQNESNLVLLEDEKSKERFIVKQIAGILARRIICWVKTGDIVQKGERFGMIKFGSRVDIFIPKSFEFTVKRGDKVKAGETIIGRKN